MTHDAMAIDIIQTDKLLTDCKSICVIGRIVNPSNHNSDKISVVGVRDVNNHYTVEADFTYGYNNTTSNTKTITTGVLGKRQTKVADAECSKDEYCSNYIVRKGDTEGAILGEDKIKIEVTNPKSDSDKFKYKAFAGKKCSKDESDCSDTNVDGTSTGRNFTFSPSVKITILDEALFGQHLAILKYICSGFDNGYCDESNMWAFNLTVNKPTTPTDPTTSPCDGLNGTEKECCLPTESNISAFPSSCLTTDAEPKILNDGELYALTRIRSAFEWTDWQNRDITLHYPIREGNTSKVATPASANADPSYVEFQHKVGTKDLYKNMYVHYHTENYVCQKTNNTNGEKYWSVCQGARKTHARELLIPKVSWQTNRITNTGASSAVLKNSFTAATDVADIKTQNKNNELAYPRDPADTEKITQNQINAGAWCQNVTASAEKTVTGTTVAGHTNIATFDKSVESEKLCYTVPLLFHFQPYVSTLTDAVEPGEEVKADVSVYAAYNKKFTSCDLGVTVSRWYVIEKPDGTTETKTLPSDTWTQCKSDYTSEIKIPSEVTASFSVGTKIHFHISVSSYTNDPYIYMPTSQPHLYIGVNAGAKDAGKTIEVTKNAALQIYGADSWSGTNSDNGGFVAKSSSSSLGAAAKSGSWSQYSLFTAGCIDNAFGSAGWLYHTTEAGSSSAHKLLKFANTSSVNNCADKLGRFSTDHRITNLRDYYQTDNKIYANNDIVDVPYDDITHYAYGSSTNLSLVNTFSGQKVLVFDGDVTITKDIISDGFADINSISTLIIIAKNIYIQSNVRQIDAVLVADDSILTCANMVGGDSYKYNGLCSAGDTGNVGLVINGAVIAKNTKFQRTNGSTTIMDSTPAERIRYNPAVYLSSYISQRTKQKNLRTILRREVAPYW